MIDLELAQLAFRVRAVSLIVATTGVITAEATATGYKRATGSFVTDGFLVGQDVTPSGFPQTAVGVVIGVTATELTILGGRTIAAPASGRSIVSGLPTLRAWENIGTTPIAGRPYIVESQQLGGSRIQSWPTENARLEQTGLSVWTWYVAAGVGVSAMKKGVTAMMSLFAPGTVLSLADSSVVRMRGDVGPTASGLVNEGGFARVTVTLPWRAHTRNVVAV